MKKNGLEDLFYYTMSSDIEKVNGIQGADNIVEVKDELVIKNAKNKAEYDLGFHETETEEQKTISVNGILNLLKQEGYEILSQELLGVNYGKVTMVRSKGRYFVFVSKLYEERNFDNMIHYVEDIIKQKSKVSEDGELAMSFDDLEEQKVFLKKLKSFKERNALTERFDIIEFPRFMMEDDPKKTLEINIENSVKNIIKLTKTTILLEGEIIEEDQPDGLTC